jgi:branched-chain amino acid transport system substrate-binding protein
MSQRNETTVFTLALLITLGFIGVGLWWFTNTGVELKNFINFNQNNASDAISFGEKILGSQEISPLEQEGVKAIADGDYKKAIASLEAALKLKRNNPQVLIFLNNARIGSRKSYTIAATLPITSDPNTALEILRGVAQAQNEINQSGGIRGVPLKVGIANDQDNPEIAKEIAKALVDNQQVLGVVGSSASDATLAGGAVYTDGQLVEISPTSTSVKISNFSHYVFRTVPSDFTAARALADYMVKKWHKKNIAVFFNSQSNYSQSLTGASGTIRFLPSGDRNAQVQLVQIIRRNSSRSGTGYDFVPVSQ